jgi:hypothetical protein
MRPLFTSREGDARSDLFSAAILKKRLDMLKKDNFGSEQGAGLSDEVVEFVKNMNHHFEQVINEPNAASALSKKIIDGFKAASPESKNVYNMVFSIDAVGGGSKSSLSNFLAATPNPNFATQKLVYTELATPPARGGGGARSAVKNTRGVLVVAGRTADPSSNVIATTIYNLEDSNAPGAGVPLIFGFNLGKYFMRQEGAPVDDQLSKIFAESADPEQIWMRDGDKIIHRQTGEVAGTNVEAACAGTKVVNGADGKSCTSYVSDCLMGQNIDECRDYFGSAGFYTNTQEEIQKMDPVVAVKMLRKFGFKEVSAYDEEEKMNIVTIEIVAKWIEGLKGVADAATIAAISGNDQLKAYLEWIVQLVNNNPAILNPGYGGNKGPDSHDPNRFGHTGFAQMGIRARRAVRNSCYRDIDAIANAIDQYNITLGIRLNAPIVGGIVPARIMIGGSMVDLSQAESSVEQLRSNRKQTSELLNKTYNYLTRKLQTHHKDISPKDKAKIGELIDDLAKKEEKLYEIIDFVEKYAMLVDIFGNRKVEEVVKLEQMQKAVQARSKLFAKKVKRETDLVSVLRSLTGAVDDQTESGESNPVGTAAGMN